MEMFQKLLSLMELPFCIDLLCLNFVLAFFVANRWIFYQTFVIDGNLAWQIPLWKMKE